MDYAENIKNNLSAFNSNGESSNIYRFTHTISYKSKQKKSIYFQNIFTIYLNTNTHHAARSLVSLTRQMKSAMSHCGVYSATVRKSIVRTSS